MIVVADSVGNANGHVTRSHAAVAGFGPIREGYPDPSRRPPAGQGVLPHQVHHFRPAAEAKVFWLVTVWHPILGHTTV